MMERIIVVGPPRSGKSSYARECRSTGIPTLCTDPRSLVKDPEEDVTYLPEGLEWSEGSQFVVDSWLPMPGPWCIEGVGTVRALRKALDQGKGELMAGARIVRFTEQHQNAVTKPGQLTMAKAIETVWREIVGRLDSAQIDVRQ